MKNKKNKVINLCLITCLFIVGAYFVDAEATTEEGLQISPTRFDWKLEGDELKSGEIIIQNFSDTTHDIEVQVEDFYVSDDSKMVHFFVPEDSHPLKAYDVINWIEKPVDFSLEPGGVKTVEFSVNVPKDQPTSGYYGSILFKTKGADSMAKNEKGEDIKLDVNYRVGTLITLAIQGEEPMKISGYLEDFDTVNKIFWDSPMTLFAKLKSDGNVHYKAGGEMRVDKFGKRFAVVKIEDEVMYPEKTRTFTEQIMFGPWDYGVYSASLDMESDDGSVVFVGDVPIFFVIPWKTTLLIVSGIAFIIILIAVFKKKFKIVKNDKKTKTKK